MTLADVDLATRLGNIEHRLFEIETALKVRR
jgi:hypothetical protein